MVFLVGYREKEYNAKMKFKNTKTVLLVCAGLIVAYCVFVAWKFNVAEPSTPPVANKALEQLWVDLQTATPHFVEATKADAQTLTLSEQKIKDDVTALFIAGQPDSSDYYSQLWLDAIGKRYVLISQLSIRGSHDEILDSQTGKVTPIPGEVRFYLAPDKNIALYIDYQAIYIYALDQPLFVLVPGSKLSGNETYHSGLSDAFLVPKQTHTKDSVAISVFDSSQLVQNPDAQPNAMQTMNKNVRQIKLLLP